MLPSSVPAKQHPLAHLFETTCFLGGAKYRGVMEAFRDKNGNIVEEHILFDSPSSGSTLCLKKSQLTAQAVREHIAKSNAQFEAFADKACTRVLRQFGQPPLRLAVASEQVAA